MAPPLAQSPVVAAKEGRPREERSEKGEGNRDEPRGGGRAELEQACHLKLEFECSIACRAEVDESLRSGRAISSLRLKLGSNWFRAARY